MESHSTSDGCAEPNQRIATLGDRSDEQVRLPRRGAMNGLWWSRARYAGRPSPVWFF